MSFPDYTRRQLLQQCGMGLGMLGLADLLSAESGKPVAGPLAPKAPQFAPKAKRMVHLFMNGGPSHLDTFDPKPTLEKYAGKPLPTNQRTERKTGVAFPSPFKFKQYGQSGIPISDCFPHVAESADELCVIRSMYADVPNHEPSFLLMNCGDSRQARPALGSWLTYGLGSENQNLPGFVVLCPGMPTVGAQNWQAAFLPGTYQGTHLDTQQVTVDKLVENIRNTGLSPERQRKQLDLLAELNQKHQQSRQNDPQLEARIQSFELAYRMQSECTDVFDLSKEPKPVREMYGESIYGRQLLMARRMLERGVRMVQVWQGAGQPWDAHDDLQANHERLSKECDQPIGAFLKDLKQRGMLDSTLVLWGGEFGRTPTMELPTPGVSTKGNGRDHNHYGFSMWMAGGGVKRGHIHGTTDELGWNAQQGRMHVHDLHATILHLFGFDHEKLTYRYAGRDFRLTDVHGNVVREILT
ncbi:MAG: DUF1501 domain-containing protein [Planctomycetales bacterium]